MRYALYGTHGKYFGLVSRDGVSRDTAAYFLLPEQCGGEKLFATLVCSTFHAIGLQMMRSAIQNRSSLSKGASVEGGIWLLLLQLDETMDRAAPLDVYQYRHITTYPYGKVKNIGPAPPPIVQGFQVPDEIMDCTIHSDHVQRAARFFQKKHGALQFVADCSVEALEAVCVNASRAILPQLQLFLSGKK